jgi:Tfp pilus assembly protein PilF
MNFSKLDQPMGLLLFVALILPLPQAPQLTVPADRVDRAIQLIHEEKYEMAYQVLMELVKDDPTNARAFPFLAAMELQTGRLADAESHIGALLAHDPDNGDLRELSGQLSMAKRDWKKAEEQWRFLIEQRPNSEQAHIQLAAVLLQEDRYNDALGEVTRALEIAPKRSDARSLRGNILAALGQINQAALDWNIALVGDPDDTVALSGLAVFLRQTDPEQALKYAYRAVELTDWKSLGPMRVLAMVYRARREDDLAKKTLERAMVLFPNNAALAADLRGDPAPGSAPASAPPANAAAAKPPTKGDKPSAAASNKPAATAPVPSSANKPAAPATSAPPTKPTTTVAVAPPAPKPEPIIPKPPVDAVVIPPLAVGGLTLGAAVGDLLAFDVLPSPPSAKVAEAPPPAAPKPVESPSVAKAAAPSMPPSKPTTKPAETSPPVAVTPTPVVPPPPTPPPAKVTPPAATTPPPAAKPPAPVPTISVESISPLAFGGLTLGATFGDLLALEKLPAPPAEVKASAPPAASAAPPSTAAVVEAPPGKPPLAPKPSTSKKEAPPVDLHWGMIPLSTISPAFVYGDVPPPAERRP